MKDDFKIVGFIPDTHIPFEDVKAYELMLSVFSYINKKYGLYSICILGDYLDMYGVSRYEKDPSFGDIAELYDREIACGNDRLDELDFTYPNAKKIYIEGNHEARLGAYIKSNAGALRKRITVTSELNLSNRPKWSWIPYNSLQGVEINNSGLFARHEPFGTAQPKTQAMKAGDSFIYGHTHQVGEGHVISKLSSRDIVAINSGCLVDFNSPVFGFVKSRPDWKHAFTIAWTKKNKFLHQIVRISKDYECVFDGKVFKK